MILREALRSTTETLSRAGIADASVEAELLLGHVLKMSKTQLYTEPERSLTSEERERLCHLVGRRLAHEPTAYILGHCEFYGIDFCIDSDTFIPRPESELLVEKAVELARRISQQGRQVILADIGTGCGAIAVSLALALPQVRVYATDISASALRVAEINCRRHAVDKRVELLQGSLLEPLPQSVDILIANLPYIRDCEFKGLGPEVKDYEPTMALAGGEKGMDKIEQMLVQVPGRVNQGAYLLLEIGQGQGEMVTLLIKSHLAQANIELIRDLGGIERVVKVGL